MIISFLNSDLNYQKDKSSYLNKDDYLTKQ